MSNFINDMESKLSLFKGVHGRPPANSDEFVEWCAHVDRNSVIVESKGQPINVENTCRHRWTDHPTNYGVLVCNKCGKENYNTFS